MSLFKFVNSFLNRPNYSQQDAVIEVKSSDYLNHESYEREDGLFIYGVNEKNQKEKLDECEFKFEVVFIKDISSKLQTAYSIYRARNLDEAKEIFNLLSDKIPLFNMLCPQLMNETTLQDILNYTRNYPQQALIHICSHFGYMVYFKADKTLSFVDRDKLVCPKTSLTPLHLAVRSKNLELVNFLMNFDFITDLVYLIEDKDDNNVFHFAANTTKEIITALCSDKAIATLTSSKTSTNTSIPTNSTATTNETSSVVGTLSPNDDELKLKQKERKKRIQYLINKRNKQSASPLYIACSNDKAECVKVLLLNGAHLNSATLVDNNELDLNISNNFDPEKHINIIDQLEVKEFKFGGTPLHWIKDPSLIEKLLDNKVKIDGKNFKNETPLHTFTKKKNLNIVMSLLWHGAEVNCLDSNNQTPLHLAVIAGDVSIVQALVVFDADVNLKDSNGHSPRHLAANNSDSVNSDLILYTLHVVNAQRCQRNYDNLCSDGCALGGAFNGRNKDSPYFRASNTFDPLLFSEIIENALQKKREEKKNENVSIMQVDGNLERKKKRILCLDGGGIRGLIMVTMLSYLESRFHVKTYDLFDHISGTSTGSIVALAFSLGYSAKDCRKLYFRLKDKIFTGSRPYDETIFEQFLKKEFGEHTKMSDITSSNLLIPTTKADRNYESPESILGEKEPFEENDNYVWYVARCSGAAPTYFTSCDRYIDGGLCANNPTLDTIVDLTQLNMAYKATGQYHKMFEIEVICSLGTGEPPIVPVTTPKLHYPTSMFEITKLYQSFNDLFDLLVEQATQSNGQVVKRASAFCANTKTPFFRLNPPLSQNVLLNETDNAKLVKMLWETLSYCYSKENEIMKLKELLI